MASTLAQATVGLGFETWEQPLHTPYMRVRPVEILQLSGSVVHWVSHYNADGQSNSTFYPYSGVTEELKTFIGDISQATLKKGSSSDEADCRSSFVEGARDIAVLQAMLESGTKQGAMIQVKTF